ncbi:MAG: nicotinamidase [Candidatus Pacearchaeota archaeon]|jgi:nicotinamidase-related amidase|nr:isochorismatase family protein [Clostridia bacterium]
MRNCIIVIDPQKDFCSPTGSLFVNGAPEDITRISNFIKKNTETIDNIIVSLDWHQPFSIFHPSFWTDENGNQPAVFTAITLADVKAGKYVPAIAPVTVETYLEELEQSGEYLHLIWPEHCIAGSDGASIVPELQEAINEWSRTGKEYTTVLKGKHILTEFFGIFKAQVALPGVPSTDWNLELINSLNKYDNIYITGEAKSHCVAQTVKQLFEYPDVRKKLVILEDCMSNVQGFEHIADPTWEAAKSLGIKFAKSTDL